MFKKFIYLFCLTSHFRYFKLLFSILNMKKENPNKKVLLIKSPHPDNKKKKRYGDLYLAKDLAYSIDKSEDFISFVIPKHFWNRFIINKIADVSIVLRGLHKYKVSKSQSENHFMYIISHPERVSIEEMKSYKAVFVASEKQFNKFKEDGVNVFYVPQFTNTEKFYPLFDESKKCDVLFVGNSRGIKRETVKFCVDNGIDVSVYGQGWKGLIPDEYIKGEFIENSELNKYYSSVKIVLNDHWDDMKRDGFMSNRTFDVSACKGFLLSDYISDIDKVFEGGIETYKTEKEFVEKVNYYLSNEKERLDKVEKAYAITLKSFTKESIGKAFIKVIK